MNREKDIETQDEKIELVFHNIHDHGVGIMDMWMKEIETRSGGSVRFTKTSGEVIRGNYEPPQSRSGFGAANPRKAGDGFILTDIYGDEIRLPYREIKDSKYQTVPEHFIPEKLLLGKAMVIFWPVFPHFRWKLLR